MDRGAWWAQSTGLQRRLKWLISSDGHTYVFTYTDVYVYTCALGEFTHTHASLKNYILLLSFG